MSGGFLLPFNLVSEKASMSGIFVQFWKISVIKLKFEFKLLILLWKTDRSDLFIFNKLSDIVDCNVDSDFELLYDLPNPSGNCSSAVIDDSNHGHSDPKSPIVEISQLIDIDHSSTLIVPI